MRFSSERTVLLLFIFFALMSLSASSQAKLIDRVVAVVNNEVITSTEFEKVWAPIHRRIVEKVPPGKLDETLAAEKKNMLESQIDNLLISQEAAAMKINVSEAEIDQAIERVAEENEISIEKLYQELERTGINLKNYRKNIHDSIQRSKMISRNINSKIVISDEKAKEYYEKVLTTQNTPKGYHLLQIGFTWGTKESAAVTPEDAEQRAEKIKKLVDEGQNFKELARSFSELPSAEDGGDLGFFKDDDMSENLKKILTGLEPGKASNIIELSGSFQFYMILSVNSNGTTQFAPFEVFKNEIIDTLYNQEQKTRYENWMIELRDRSFIKILL